MTALRIIITLLNAGLFVCLCSRLVHIYQMGGYKLIRYLKWNFSKNNTYGIALFVVSLLGFGSTHIVSFFAKGEYAYLGLILYFILAGITVLLINRHKLKVEFKLTARIYRLFFVIFVMSCALGYVLLHYLPVQYMPISAFFLSQVMLLSAYLIWPLEQVIKQFYLAKARKKLFSPEYKDLIRIGITGSYGKTSCKNILAAMLAAKYKVVASPASFNTPMGFTRTVLQNLTPDTQVLIMEMGARRVGDIKKMCELFRPMHGILTSIGSAHLETFKTLENIYAEKYELLNSIPEGGIKIDGYKGGNGSVLKYNLKYSLNTGKCKMVSNGETILEYKTSLLGEHNQRNIALCADMALQLGVTREQIEAVAAKLKPTPHRLELIEGEKGVRILDDSYNSSPHGARAALDVLRDLAMVDFSVKNTMPTTVVITPGMVELGTNQYIENRYFARQMRGIVDHVIIVGETNKKALLEGLRDEGKFEESRIHSVRDLEEGKKIFSEILKPGDILLIENDLPDNL
jgi:UDP-N-acetylmuramoyl-tripeptide--D-alanyl-D-alanine ligase